MRRLPSLTMLLLLLAPISTSHADYLDILLEESDVVARVRVDRVASSWTTINGQRGIFTRVEATVLERFVGPAEPRVAFYLVGGVVGDRAVVASHQPWFREGEEAVVFLFRGGDVLFPTGELGKWLVRRGGPPMVEATAEHDGHPVQVVQPWSSLRGWLRAHGAGR